MKQTKRDIIRLAASVATEPTIKRILQKVLATKSPNYNMTLTQLKAIRDNNYFGAGGTEYTQEEVDQRIMELGGKQMEKAGKAWDREFGGGYRRRRAT